MVGFFFEKIHVTFFSKHGITWICFEGDNPKLMTYA